MSVIDVLDTLDELVEKSWNLPLSGGKCVVDAERMLALLDEVRNSLPEEIRLSQQIVEDRRSILENAKKESEQIIRRAEERARNLVRQEEIFKNAQSNANELLVSANTRSKEIRAAAGDYADAILKECEDQISASLGDIRSTRSRLKAKRGQSPQQ